MKDWGFKDWCRENWAFCIFVGLVFICSISCLATCNAQRPTQPSYFGMKLGSDYLDYTRTGGYGVTVFLSNHFLTDSVSGGASVSLSKLPMTTDSIYVEFYVNLGQNGDFGIATNSVTLVGTSLGFDAFGWSYLSNPGAPDFSGLKAHNGSPTTYGSVFNVTDTIMIGYNGTSHKVFFGKNGTWQGSSDPVTGVNPAFSGLASATNFYFAVGSFSGVLGKYTYNPLATTYKPTGWHNPHL